MPRPLLPLALALLAAPALAEGPFRDLGFEEALALATREEKVVFVDFFTTWCGPCKKLDRITWKDPQVIAWLEANTIALKVDAEEDRQLASRYGVRSYPSLVFLSGDGQPKGALVGFRAPRDFLKEAGDIVAGVQLSVRLRERWMEDPGNPMRRHELARQLERELAYAEATEHYLWCWDHGTDEPDRQFGAVRRGDLLKDLGRLMRLHPPCMSALMQRRDRARDGVLGEQPEADACADYVRLNETLADRKHTLATYDRLGERASREEAPAQPTPSRGSFDPRGALFEHVVDLLLEAQRYAEAAAGYGDPELWLEGRLAKFESLATGFQQPELVKAAQKQGLADGTQLYEALVGTREHDPLAGRVALRLVEFEKGPKPWIELMYAARRAGRKDLQEELRRQALAVLPLFEHKRIPRVREREQRR